MIDDWQAEAKRSKKLLFVLLGICILSVLQDFKEDILYMTAIFSKTSRMVMFAFSHVSNIVLVSFTTIHRVSKNVPPLACYNFDTREWILIFFLEEMLPMK